MAEKVRVGNVEITNAKDAEFRMAAGVFLRNAQGGELTREDMRPYIGDADPMEPEESRVSTFVVRSQGKTILVDAGVGAWGLWRFGDGHLLDSLKALDIAPEDVDFVVPTHLHLDHVGWNTRPSPNGPVPTFPRARYIFQQRDWDHYTSDAFLNNTEGPMPAMMRSAVIPLKDSGLMDLSGPEAKITDEVTLLHTPGHTPGSVTILVQSNGESALLMGDVAHHSAQLTETDWSPIIEVDVGLSRRSRKAVVDRAVALDAVIAGGHFAASDPVFGRMVLFEGRRVWRGVTL
jgi:glyoxylase-like metal-dependent hydrolase (beta-lactamase superfamily II)